MVAAQPKQRWPTRNPYWLASSVVRSHIPTMNCPARLPSWKPLRKRGIRGRTWESLDLRAFGAVPKVRPVYSLHAGIY